MAVWLVKFHFVLKFSVLILTTHFLYQSVQIHTKDNKDFVANRFGQKNKFSEKCGKGLQFWIGELFLIDTKINMTQR